MIENTLIARQPILLENETQFAYELLFRSVGGGNLATISDDRFATSRVLIDALNTFGPKSLIGELRAFVNIDKNFLMDAVVESIPKDRFVLEILETVKVDDEIVARVKELKERGYRFAIDDLDFSDEMIENFSPLLELVDILKIDLLACGDIEKAGGIMKKLSHFNCEFLAEKVEDRDMFEKCKALGFKYFQGYFFSKPTIIEGKKLDPNKAAIMNLIRLLQTDEEIEVIVDEFSRNPQLTLNLLKYMNSSAFFTKNEISSISHAIKLLGRLPLAQWLTLYLYASSGKGEASSDPLLQSAIYRANSMSIFAERLKMDKKRVQKSYLVGLASLFDAILNATFENIFEEIKFDSEIKEAILEKKGSIGKLLQIACIIESGNMDKIEALSNKLNISPEDMSQMLFDIQSATVTN